MSISAEEEIGQPGGVLAGHVDDGEVKHVDHPTVQPTGVAAAVGEEGGHLREGALAEDTPVEHAVNNVADGARGDESDAKQHTELGLFLRQAHQHPEQGDDGDEAEQAEGQLQDTAAAHPTEGHAVVFDKQKVVPVNSIFLGRY